MTKKKLSAKNIAIISLTSAGLGVSISLSLAHLLETSFITTWAWINGLGNLPLFLSVSDALRQELGLRSPIQIIGNNGRRAFGRKIPINAGDKSKNIFMQTLRLPSGSPATEQNSYEPVDTISIWDGENTHTLTIPEIQEFINISWHRQTRKKDKNGKRINGFSRAYWTKKYRPSLTTLEYNIRMWALTPIDGLIIDRGEGRSGRLSVPPNEAIQIIRSVYL